MNRSIFHIFTLFAIAVCLLQCTAPKKSSTDIAYAKDIQSYRDSITREKGLDEKLSMDADDLKHIHYFAPDTDYRVTCTVLPLTDSIKIVDTYAKKKKQIKPYALLKGTVKGKELNLTTYQYVFRGRIVPDHLFVPVIDATSGESTYGGGRYVDLNIKDITDGKIVLDFNKLYNPLCAYRDGYNCIIPPVENHIDVELLAGEKQYTGEH